MTAARSALLMAAISLSSCDSSLLFSRQEYMDSCRVRGGEHEIERTCRAKTGFMQSGQSCTNEDVCLFRWFPEEPK